MTLSSSPVTYTVETNSEFKTGTVTNTTLKRLEISLGPNVVVLDSSYQYRNKGIHVSANNEISVLLINYEPGSIGEYLAYPVQNLNITKYTYYAVSTGVQTDFHVEFQSEILLVGTEDNTTVTVVPTQNIAVPQNVQLPNSPEINVAANTSFSLTLHEMQTFLFGAPLKDITGTSIVSDKPLTVISGHECGNVHNILHCEHLTEQIHLLLIGGSNSYLLHTVQDQYNIIKL